MNNWCWLILCGLMMSTSLLFGQEQEEHLPTSGLDPLQDRMDWIPTLLTANSSALMNAVSFHGGIFSWRLRGGQTSVLYVDGLDWSAGMRNWKPGGLFVGFQNAIFTESVVFNDVFTEKNFNQAPIAFYKSSRPIEVKKSWTLQTALSNRLHGNALSLYFNSGSLVSNWRYRIGGFAQWMPAGAAAIGFKESAGFLFSAERKLKNQKQVNMSLIWNYNNQSRENTTLKEMFSLAGQSNYQSNWGWRNQQMFFPSTSQNNTAVISLQLKKQHTEYRFSQFSNGIAVGYQGQSSLEWNNSSDPRPDYYRHLPSFLSDSLLRNALTLWLGQHPEQLQMQFDAMGKINKSSGRSFYMINQQMNKLFLWHGNFQMTNYFSNWNYQFGIDYALERVRSFQLVKDLLGGNYYLNYNNWMNDDGNSLVIQNDILHPDRKIKKGEKWGPDYAIFYLNIRPWVQLFHESPHFETAVGLGLGAQGFQRTGYNVNGLQGSHSKGAASFQSFPSWDIKVQSIYKYTGRWYGRSIAYYRQLAPTSDSYYLQPDMSAISNPYANANQEQGIDLSIIYHSPLVKWTTSVYWKKNEQASLQKMFYHDAFASFVYGVAGDIQTTFKGLEASVETTWLPKVQMSWVGNLQQNLFAENVPYQLLYLNDLHVLTSGTLFLKKLPSSNIPSWSQAFSFNYQPVFSWRLGWNYIYAFQRPVSMDIFRRSDWVKNKLDPESWKQLLELPLLPSEGVLNCFVSKSFQKITKKGILKWYMSLSARNVLHTWIPIFAYEQSRFDYLHFNNQKYALKYFMDKGPSYTMRIQLQIQ